MSHPRTISVADLAARLGGNLQGDGALIVRRVATMEEADGDCLSWVGSEALMPRASESRAGVLLIPDSCQAPPGRTCIRVADPDRAMCVALALLGPEPDRIPIGVDEAARVASDAEVQGAAIGPFVRVGSKAVIGPGTQLHPGVCIDRDVRIGGDCVLWPGVVVREGTTIGDRVVIHANAVIGADGFGYLQREGVHVKIPQVGRVVIEDDVEIGALTAIDRARSGETRIGRGTKIDNLVQIAHNVQIGEHCIIVSQVGIAGSTSLGRQVVMAGRAGAVDHVRIGDGVQVAACSVVFSDVAPGSVVRGVPAVDHRQFLREQAGVRKIGKWIDKVKTLIKRVDRLEGEREE
jgi:UDP-3-O-[3-hydroxymyristoyl] glucosamine N-acyltransferase